MELALLLYPIILLCVIAAWHRFHKVIDPEEPLVGKQYEKEIEAWSEIVHEQEYYKHGI